MSARSDAALSLAGGILGGLAIGTLIARRYFAERPVAVQPYSQADTITATVTKLASRRSKP